MRRLPIILACASAAALTTLAVTVAVPAIADDGPGAKDGFAACLRDHGLAGAPDDETLKPWVGERLDSGDVTAKRAFQACVPQKSGIPNPGPSEQELRSCLADHGVEVPAGDGRALKQWLLEHGNDTANRDALKACDMAPIPKPAGAGACGGEKGPVGPAERADKIAKAKALRGDANAN
jgi:hypothetical protein